MIRYLLSVLAMFCFATLNLILAPVLPLFREWRLGPVDNANAYRVEPRLPWWLTWFDTSDNSLYGDGGWKNEHCKAYDSYFGMVRWLWRNGGHNFNYKVLGCRTGVLHRRDGCYFTYNDEGFWLYRRFIPLAYEVWFWKWRVASVGIAGKYLELFFGWNLSGEPDESCKVACQVRIRSSTN